MPSKLSALALSLAALLALQGVRAQETPQLPPDTEVTADSLEYLDDRNMIVGSGSVLVQQGADSLQSDYMTINTVTKDVFARGNVVFRQAGKVWELQEFKYNLLTKKGDFGEFKAYVAPYYITAKESKRISTNEFYLKEVTLTTCEGDDPEYLISADEATLKGDQLRARGVVLRFGFLPFFYTPTFARKLSAHDRYFEAVPGYSSRHGAYLLTAYNYPVAGEVRGRTRLDYRSKRGFGTGQDFLWEDRSTNQAWSGEFNAYYADDDEPFRSAEEEAAEGDLVDNERYRLRLSHVQNFTPRDYMIADLNYLSDPDVLEDFFDDEYGHGAQPENRVTLTHRGDKYTAGILVNKRLNDFYENVDRLPEVSLNLQRQRIGESAFYYDSDSTASYLEHVYPDDSDEEDFEAFRVDSRHTVYLPTRHFGFLNVIPRAGYRGTFYSETRTQGVATNLNIVSGTNGQSSVTTQFVGTVESGDAELRSLYELGLESSFKAFKSWDDLIVLTDGDGLRHVAEPYMNYTLNPEPNVRPYELPQFDEVDTLDERQDVLLGIRNKFQTRKRGYVHDLVDLNVYSTYRIEIPDNETNDFSDVFFDAELRLADRFPVDFDGSYDAYEGEVKTFNTQLSYLMNDASSIGLEYRHRKDEQDLISTELILFPNNAWSFEIYGRYEAQSGRLEEQSYFVSHKRRCLGYGIGVNQEPGYDGEEDDYQIWFRLWVLAFPDSTIKLGQ